MRRLTSASAIVAMLLVTGCSNGSAGTGSGSPGPTVTAAPSAISVTASPSPAEPTGSTGPQSIEAAGARRISISPAADWLMIVDGNVWTAAGGGIAQLDPVTGQTRAFTELLGICLGFDAGYGSLWAGGCDDPAIWRIEPATGEVLATIDVPVTGIEEEGSVAAGEGGVWVISTEHQLVKIDPTSNTVAGTWNLPAGAAAVRAGLGSLWVTVSDANQLLKIDPSDPTRQTAVSVGAYPRFLTVGGDAVWVMNQHDGSISRVSAAGTVLGTTRIADRIEGGDIAFGGGSVWVQPGGQLLVQLDPSSGEVVAEYGPRSGSGGVAADDAAVWVTAHDVDAVWRLPLR